MKPRLLLPALAAAIFLLAAPGAFGAVYCVGSPAGCVGTNEGNDLQAALDAAKATTSTADQVQVGLAGSPYTAPTGFNYTDVNNANTVDIVGVGSPTVTLTGTASQQHALTLDQTGSTVSGLSFTVPDTAHSLFGLQLQGSTAHDITATTPSSSMASNTGVQLVSATLRNSTINGGFSFSYGVDARSSSVVKDNTIYGDRGVFVFGSNVQVSRNRISSDYHGIEVGGGAPINIDNDLIDMRGGAGAVAGPFYGLEATTSPSFTTTTVNASELTIRNGDANTIGVEEDVGAPTSIITVNLTDSIIRDVGNASEIGPVASPQVSTLNADHDDYDKGTDLPASLGAGQVRTETNMVNVDPLFVAAISGTNGILGNYELSPTSPVIDAGSATPLAAGETDLAGQPRIVDGAAPCSGAVRDLGAYEYQGPCPVSQQSSTPPPTGTTPAPVAKKCKKKKKHRASAAKKCKKKRR